MVRWHVVSAVFGRNVKQYFSGVLGYLFIVVFVTVCAVMAFSQQFFADNLANLDQLSRWYPVLLLFFIPAITMSVWADEKRMGTDAILFTLPASDLEILLGKYFAVAAVYTIALLFSSTQLIALSLIGDPDWGVIAATYVGYWVAGLAMLSIGMFASSLTKSATVAFVVGGMLCAIPVLIGYYFRGNILLERLGMDWNLRDFTVGLIPLANVIYFFSLTGFMLYLNLVVVSRRHWSRGQQVSLGSQFLIRVASLAVALVALNFIVSTASASLLTRLDLTHEKLYSLDAATIATINKARENKRVVSVQAFVSDDVPRKYVNIKKQFTGLLRQFSFYGGNYVDVRFVDVKPNSPEEQEAQKLGIEPQDDRSDVGGKMVEQKVYMGALVSGTHGDVQLPFIDSDDAIEYELSRSIASATEKGRRLTIGLVETDAHFGGPEIDGRRINWAYNKTLEELKKQFRIKYIKQDEIGSYVGDQPADDNSESAIEMDDENKKDSKTPPDVLLVADPSSLNDMATDALVRYLEAGHPAILLADPLPFFWTFQNPINLGVLNAPRQPRVSPRSPYAQILTSSPMPKADGGRATRILNALGIQWDNGQAAWNLTDPHPGFNGAWPEYLGGRWPEYYGPYEKAFVWVKSQKHFENFNPDSPLSAGLKELLFFYPGTIRKDSASDLKFTPLVTLEPESGVTDWQYLTKTPMQQLRRINPSTGRATTTERPAMSQITQDNLVVVEPTPQSYMDENTHVLAAHITGATKQTANSGGGNTGTGAGEVNAVFITDLDFLSDLSYTQDDALGPGQQLDNLTFLKNAIEILTGDEEFVALRNRRTVPRTLTRVEEQVDKYRADRVREQEEIEKEIRRQLETAQTQLNEAAKKIEENQSLSFFEKLQQTSQEASDAQRRFDLQKEKLDKDLNLKIAALKAEESQKISWLENRIRAMSVMLAPVPALVLGIVVLMVRTANERKHISADRRAD